MSIYYVRSSGGSDSYTGLSFAQAWATIGNAAFYATAGDTVLICADGIHYPASPVSLTAFAIGAIMAPITYRGASATGADDGTVATISGNSLSAGQRLFALSAHSFIDFHNLTLTESPGVAFNITNNTSAGSINLKECSIISNDNTGVFIESTANGAHDIVFNNCTIADNGNIGAAVYDNANFINCTIANNGNFGISWNLNGDYPGFNIKGCNIYGNAASGLRPYANYSWGNIITNNVLYNNGGSGLEFANPTLSGARMTLFNNIFKDNAAYGIYIPSGTSDHFTYIDYNCYYGNTSGHCNFNGGVPYGNYNKYIDPLFLSETPGAEDFRTYENSLCRGTGYGYNG